MPILHFQAIAGQAKTPNGRTVNLPPNIALAARGPVVQVSVSIGQDAGKALASQGKPLPASQSGLALVDTGASNSCIDDEIAKKLGLPVIDVGFMISASHEKVPCNIYPILIATPVVNFNLPRAMGAALSGHRLVAIIGRDILQDCTFFYNGAAGEFTLAM